MYYAEAIREAARRADAAARDAIDSHKDDTLSYEPDITSGLAALLKNALNGQIEGLIWSSHVTRSGAASGAEESSTGADLIIQVKFDSPEVRYSKGVLIQAKRVEPNRNMDARGHRELVDQCEKMLDITAASFVFDYAKSGMRCAPASSIVRSNNSELYAQCVWTSYRFFFELFRCPIGDSKITSARVRDLPIRNKLTLRARGRGERSLL